MRCTSQAFSARLHDDVIAGMLLRNGLEQPIKIWIGKTTTNVTLDAKYM